MKRCTHWGQIVLLAGLLAACAASQPRGFGVERAAAERAYAHGRYAEAARHWRRAEGLAEQRRDRLEARYRAASALARAGQLEQASALYSELAQGYPSSERAARSEYELARIEIAKGQPAGYRRLSLFVRRYPRSGLAGAALKRYSAWLLKERGRPALLHYLGELARDAREPALLEQVLYTRAKTLEAGGQLRAAYAEYLELARRFPYPQGALWDDALYAAALLANQFREPRTALGLLERMLAEQEPSHLQGSYERPRYADARLLRARLLRDELRDPARARRAFREVCTEHPTSLLCDDALFEEARVAHGAGDPNGACDALRFLARRVPDSRYVPCIGKLCPRLAKASAGRCRAYIERTLLE